MHYSNGRSVNTRIKKFLVQKKLKTALKTKRICQDLWKREDHWVSGHLRQEWRIFWWFCICFMSLSFLLFFSCPPFTLQNSLLFLSILTFSQVHLNLSILFLFTLPSTSMYTKATSCLHNAAISALKTRKFYHCT